MPLVDPVSPPHEDEPAVVDRLGPDEDLVSDGEAVPSREIMASDELRIDDDEDERIEHPKVAQKPMGMTSPVQPTEEEIALHWLTHLPYRSWCKWCVAAKRQNAPHCSLPASNREVPLLVADYCYVRDGRDQDLLTCLVAWLYPRRAIFSVPCDVKGADDYAT